MDLAQRSPGWCGLDLGFGDRLRLYLRRPLQHIAIATMALADDKLTSPQRRLEPLATPPILPHRTGFNRKDVSLSSIARNFGMRCSARCLTLIVQTRHPAPRRMQQRLQTIAPSSKRSTRTCLPQPANPPPPPHGNRRPQPAAGVLGRLPVGLSRSFGWLNALSVKGDRRSTRPETGAA